MSNIQVHPKLLSAPFRHCVKVLGDHKSSFSTAPMISLCDYQWLTEVMARSQGSVFQRASAAWGAAFLKLSMTMLLGQDVPPLRSERTRGALQLGCKTSLYAFMLLLKLPEPFLNILKVKVSRMCALLIQWMKSEACLKHYSFPLHCGLFTQNDTSLIITFRQHSSPRNKTVSLFMARCDYLWMHLGIFTF